MLKLALALSGMMCAAAMQPFDGIRREYSFDCVLCGLLQVKPGLASAVNWRFVSFEVASNVSGWAIRHTGCGAADCSLPKSTRTSQPKTNGAAGGLCHSLLLPPQSG